MSKKQQLLQNREQYENKQKQKEKQNYMLPMDDDDIDNAQNQRVIDDYDEDCFQDDYDQENQENDNSEDQDVQELLQKTAQKFEEIKLNHQAQIQQQITANISQAKQNNIYIDKSKQKQKLDQSTVEINKNLKMPQIDDVKHLQHPVDLNDTRRDKEKYQIIDEQENKNLSFEQANNKNDDSIEMNGRANNQSKLTSILDPKNILGDNNSMITQTTSKVTYKGPSNVLRTIEERNPYQFIEKALDQAKEKLQKMRNTPQIIESLTDNEKKKRYLKNENKQLRDQLKLMSDNVNMLIEKMNQETLRKNKYNRGSIYTNSITVNGENRTTEQGSNASKLGRPISSIRIKAADQELLNSDKAIQILVKEHSQLKKRLIEVQNPQFLLNLKNNLKEIDVEIQRQKKITKQLHNDQIRREHQIDKMIEKNDPDSMKQINDKTQKLNYLNEKLAELQEEKQKTEELKSQQSNTLDDLRQKMQKLQQIAQQYGVNLETHHEEQKQFKMQQDQHESLQKQKNILQASLEAQRRKYESILAEKKKEHEQMQLNKAQIMYNYNQKLQILKNKGQEIQDLIEKARGSGADEELQILLKRWEESNKKSQDQYESDWNQIIPNQNVNFSQSQVNDNYISEMNLKEMTVQEYLKEIKRQEKDLTQKAKDENQFYKEQQIQELIKKQQYERQHMLEVERKKLEEEAIIKQQKDQERLQIEYDVQDRLKKDHLIQIQKKEAEKQFIEEKMKEGEVARKILEQQKAKIMEETQILIQQTQNQQETAIKAIDDEIKSKLQDQEEFYKKKLKEEEQRRLELEKIKNELEEKQKQMEENMKKREEEEARLRAIEERIRWNQQNRLKTLESELQRRDALFDEAKQTELEKLQKAEQDRQRRSMEFKQQMEKEQAQWKKQTEIITKAIEKQIRQQYIQKRLIQKSINTSLETINGTTAPDQQSNF